MVMRFVLSRRTQTLNQIKANGGNGFELTNKENNNVFQNGGNNV